MLYVVTYDVPDDPRRNRLARVLKDFGTRVQYSVFECVLDEQLLERMMTRIRESIEEGEDHVRVYPLCGACAKTAQVLGEGAVTKDPEVYIV